MRTLPTGNGDAQWENSLINDLAFIKKHLRYPLTRKTLVPSFISGIILAYMLRMAWMIWIMHTAVTKHNFFDVMPYIMILIIALPLVFTTYAYMQVLRFQAVKTVFFSAENQQLIQKFLQSQHLVIYRHPDAPEVFQIISKNINANRNKDQREIMIFIADDKRILINSHLTNVGFSFNTYSRRHYKEMAKRLQEWIKIHLPENANTSIVSSNTF
jgi:hypothetical protein